MSLTFMTTATGRHSRIDYRAADVGLNDNELRERIAAYSDRFL